MIDILSIQTLMLNVKMFPHVSTTVSRLVHNSFRPVRYLAIINCQTKTSCRRKNHDEKFCAAGRFESICCTVTPTFSMLKALWIILWERYTYYDAETRSSVFPIEFGVCAQQDNRDVSRFDVSCLFSNSRYRNIYCCWKFFKWLIKAVVN
jgi:hypothetical protein